GGAGETGFAEGALDPSGEGCLAGTELAAVRAASAGFAAPYSTDLICVSGILRSIPSSPATTMSVCELATTVPGTLPPSARCTNACGPLGGAAAGVAAGVSAAAFGASVESFFEQEASSPTPSRATRAMTGLIPKAYRKGRGKDVLSEVNPGAPPAGTCLTERRGAGNAPLDLCRFT